MQGFKLSKSSWHFRLLRWSGNWRMYSNFCDYFWAVARAMFKYVFLACMIAIVLGAVCVFIWSEPFVFLAIISSLTLLACGGIKIEEIKERRGTVDKSPGFFSLKYRSFKDKFCPKIEWAN